jgi:hypothetical protein
MYNYVRCKPTFYQPLQHGCHFPLFTDDTGVEQLKLDGGNIVDTAGNIYTYDDAKNELSNSSTPAKVLPLSHLLPFELE